MAFIKWSQFWVAITMLFVLAESAQAWVPMQDYWQRAQIEYQGGEHKLLTLWPLPAVSLEAEQASGCEYNNQGSGRFQAGVRHSNEPPVLLYFGDQLRTESQLSLAGCWERDLAAARLELRYVEEADGDWQARGDGSYLFGKVGEWRLGAAAVEQWWGPGWDSSLILSNNARPVPSLMLYRDSTEPFETRWLDWLGPWQLVTFMGRLEDDRAIPNALLWGARFTFKPWPRLEIGLSRTAMWAGDGRPKGLDVFGDLLIGKDNYDSNDPGKSEEPGNQLGGVDWRWQFTQGADKWVWYGQVIGEDEAGNLPSRPVAQTGMSYQGILGPHMVTAFLEVSDTTVDVLKGDDRYNVAYEHSTYTSGYRYKGRALASTYDNDSRVVSLGWLQTFPAGFNVALILRDLDLNRDDANRGNAGGHSFSPVRAQTRQVEMRVQKPWQSVTLNAQLKWNQEDEIIEALAYQWRGTLALEAHF